MGRPRKNVRRVKRPCEGMKVKKSKSRMLGDPDRIKTPRNKAEVEITNEDLIKRIQEYRKEIGMLPSVYYTNKTVQTFYDRPWGPCGETHVPPDRREEVKPEDKQEQVDLDFLDLEEDYPFN